MHLVKYTYRVHFFQAGTCQSLGEVFSIKQRFDFNLHLVLGTKGTLGLFNFTAEFLNSAVVLANILALLFLVQLDEMFHDSLIKVLTT